MKFSLPILCVGVVISATVFATTPPSAPGPASDAVDAPSLRALPPLPHTMVLALRGRVTGIDPTIDFSLAVSGPDFSASTSLANSGKPDKQLRLDFKGTVEMTNGLFFVRYALNWSVPSMEVTNPYGTYRMTYQNYSLENSAYMKADAPLTLLDEQGRKLTLTIIDPTETPSVKPLPPRV